MALSPFQIRVCRTLAGSRRTRESHVARGVALNLLLDGRRQSRDVDLFHDSQEALARTVEADLPLLARAGFEVRMLRQSPAFTEAVVSADREETLVQWTQDSAFRFFPLVENELLGLALHPFDLATNKVLAMAGRLEARDWVDLILSVHALQPLGYLVWAACGKDPGYNPVSLLQQIRRTSRYSQAEIDLLAFEGPAPSAQELGADWKAMLTEAEKVVVRLPGDRVGMAVLLPDNSLCRLSAENLVPPSAESSLRFHAGRLRGAWPVVHPAPQGQAGMDGC